MSRRSSFMTLSTVVTSLLLASSLWLSMGTPDSWAQSPEQTDNNTPATVNDDGWVWKGPCTICPDTFHIPLSTGEDIVMQPSWRTVDFERWVPEILRHTSPYEPIGFYPVKPNTHEVAYIVYPKNPAFQMIVNFETVSLQPNKFRIHEIIAMGQQHRTPEGIHPGSHLSEVAAVYPDGHWEYTPDGSIYLVPNNAPYTSLYVSKSDLPATFPTWIRQVKKPMQYQYICRQLYHLPVSWIRWNPHNH